MPYDPKAARAAYEAGGDDYGPTELWEPGWYVGQIVHVEDSLVPKGRTAAEAQMMRLDFEVRRGADGDDRKVLRRYLCYLHPNATAQTIALRQLGELTAVLEEESPEDWLGRKVDVRLKSPKRKETPDGYVNDDEVAAVKALGTKTGVVKPARRMSAPDAAIGDGMEPVWEGEDAPPGMDY